MNFRSETGQMATSRRQETRFECRSGLTPWAQRLDRRQGHEVNVAAIASTDPVHDHGIQPSPRPAPVIMLPQVRSTWGSNPHPG